MVQSDHYLLLNENLGNILLKNSWPHRAHARIEVAKFSKFAYSSTRSFHYLKLSHQQNKQYLPYALGRAGRTLDHHRSLRSNFTSPFVKPQKKKNGQHFNFFFNIIFTAVVDSIIFLSTIKFRLYSCQKTIACSLKLLYVVGKGAVCKVEAICFIQYQ